MEGANEDPSLRKPFTIILPFLLSGQRRIQTVLLKEYVRAVEAVNRDDQFDVWLLYMDDSE